MSNSQPGFITDHLLVKIHQLCKCCQPLAGQVVQFSAKPDGQYYQFNHYGTLQDLIDGTRGGCHLCNMAYDSFKRNCKRIDEQVYPWLQSLDYSSKDQASKIRIKTWSRYTCYIIHLDIHDDHPCLGEFNLKFQDPLSTPINPYTELQLSTRVASVLHYQLIQKWLKICTDGAQHPACNDTGQFRRPTRLLDLNCFYNTDGGFTRHDVKLIEGKSSVGKYASLSYCWGSVQQVKLLRINLKQFQERIVFSELSQVTRDAIVVCRRLSIPFLWIDALCIIQGEDGDFLTEAPRMQDVYSGSMLNIVAAESKDTTEPFLVNRNPLPWLRCTLKDETRSLASERFTTEPIGFCTSPQMRNKPGEYLVDTRAWCLQERFMSPRGIFFGPKGLHWECRQGLACEFDMVIKQNHFHGIGVTKRLKAEYAKLQSAELQGRLERSEAHLIWDGLVQAYSKMELSHSEDVLIAIAGIASSFKVKLQSKSTYGLWVDFLVQELLWRHRYDEDDWRSNTSSNYLPSWSWTSVHGNPIRMFPKVPWLRQGDYHYSAVIISWPSDAGFDIRFLQGPRDLRLCIRGYLSSYTETWQGWKPENAWERVTRWPSLDPGAPKTDLFCLLLFCKYAHGQHENYGLILTPVNLKERLYRRVGVIEEEHPTRDYTDEAASSWVNGMFFVDLWSPLGEEQEIFIV